jgi:diaminopropionate ammonia-lyase
MTNRALIFANPSREPGDAFAPNGPVLREFHARLPHYDVAPLVDAPGVAAEVGAASVSVKNESQRLGLPSFKILGASWAVYRLLVERLGREPSWAGIGELRDAFAPLGQLTLVAATDGNHGRAVAHMATLLGFGARILVPRGTAAARIAGIADEGATVMVIDGTYDDAVLISAAMASDDALVVSDTSWVGYTDVPRTVIDGYRTIFDEVDEQLAGMRAPAPDLVVVPMGVGALAAAAVQRYAATASIAVVEPLSAACGLRSAQAGAPVVAPGPHTSIMAGLNCGNVSIVAWPTLARGVDRFVAIPDPPVEQAMRDLATIGIVAGETGAASLAGLRALAQARPEEVEGRHVIVLCTEGPTDPDAYERIVGPPPQDALLPRK